MALNLEVCTETGRKGGECKAGGSEAGKGDGAGNVQERGKKTVPWLRYAAVPATVAVLGYDKARAMIASFCVQGTGVSWWLIAARVCEVVKLFALRSAEIILRVLFTLYSLLFTLWIFN